MGSYLTKPLNYHEECQKNSFRFYCYREYIEEREKMAEQADFAKLFLPLQGDLLAYILAMGVPAVDADDVLQTSATIVLKKIGQFQVGTNFRAWAFSMPSLTAFPCRTDSWRASQAKRGIRNPAKGPVVSKNGSLWEKNLTFQS